MWKYNRDDGIIITGMCTKAEGLQNKEGYRCIVENAEK